MRSSSPLRYPGGKASLYPLFLSIVRANHLSERRYVEPYSGGCGLGLSLLTSGVMTRLHINDVDRSIWSFWNAVLNHTDDLIALIERTPVTVEEWRRQRVVQTNKEEAEAFELGFSTFFLNRTNRSGIIHSGGMIGGLKQNGAYKIDCRFNKIELIRRISRIAKYKGSISLSAIDGNQLVQEGCSRSVFYVDPPYYDKGSTLYMNAYHGSDHEQLAETLQNAHMPWILTYDDVQGIRNLYKQNACYDLEISYSVQKKRKGKELLIVREGLTVPANVLNRRAH